MHGHLERQNTTANYKFHQWLIYFTVGTGLYYPHYPQTLKKMFTTALYALVRTLLINSIEKFYLTLKGQYSLLEEKL